MFFFADLEQQVISQSIRAVLYGGAVIIITALVAIRADKKLKPKQFSKYKMPLFAVIVATTVGVTGLLTYNTAYVNLVSESKGPVHWHADIEFWACDSEIELRDPTGFLSNKIGTSTYHEHNDKRIHLEGVVIELEHDASLGKFMEVTGGYIDRQGVGIPVNEDSSEWLASSDHQDGDQQSTEFLGQMSSYVGENSEGKILNLRNGMDACGEGNSELQVFVYTYDKATNSYTQRKVEDPASYVVRDESVVPPGDCIIVEFDSPKQATDRICQQFGVRDSDRCTDFGVMPYNPDLCDLEYRGVEGGSSI